MVADFIISIINFFIAKMILPLLPTSMPFFSFNNLMTLLNPELKSDIIFMFSGIGKIFPITLIFGILIVILLGEGILATIKGVMYLINLVRGAGA